MIADEANQYTKTLGNYLNRLGTEFSDIVKSEVTNNLNTMYKTPNISRGERRRRPLSSAISSDSDVELYNRVKTATEILEKEVEARPRPKTGAKSDSEFGMPPPPPQLKRASTKPEGAVAKAVANLERKINPEPLSPVEIEKINKITQKPKIEETPSLVQVQKEAEDTIAMIQTAMNRSTPVKRRVRVRVRVRVRARVQVRVRARYQVGRVKVSQ